MIDDRPHSGSHHVDLLIGQITGVSLRCLGRREVGERVKAAHQETLVSLAAWRLEVDVAAMRVGAAVTQQRHNLRKVNLAEARQQQRRVLPRVEPVNLGALVEQHFDTGDVTAAGSLVEVHQHVT